MLTFFIDRITNQRFGRRRSRFDNTFKGSGVPIESKWFQESVTSIFYWIYLRQQSAGELRFELEGISMVVNWRFNVIYRKKTGCNWVQRVVAKISSRTYTGEELMMIICQYCIYWPTSKPKCRTVWIPYIGIELSILYISFRLEFFGVVVNFTVVQYRPV